MKKKRLVFITEYLGVNTNSTSYYWTKIIERLSLENDALIIAPNSIDNRSYLKDKNIPYILFDVTERDKVKLISRLFHYIQISYSCYKVMKNNISNDDIIISGTNPIFSLFFINKIKIDKKIKWILLGYDIFPENLVAAGIISNRNPIYRLARRIFNYYYSKPNKIIAVGRDMKDLLELKTRRENVCYIPNWSDENNIMPLNTSNIKLFDMDTTSSNDVVFQFFGNFGKLQDVYNIIQAIKKNTAKNAKFIFIGNGSEAKEIKSQILKMNDKRVVWIGPCNMSDNVEALNCCDIAFVSLRKGMKGLAVPSKSYFSLAADKPIIVIGDVGSELHLLSKEYPIGWFVNADDSTKLSALIDFICSNPEKIKDMRPRESLLNNFTEENSLNAIDKLIGNYLI